MKSIQPSAGPPSRTAVTCDLAGSGVVQATPETLPDLRKGLDPPGAEPLPAAFFKHVDDQTVLGLAAVARAMRGAGLAAPALRDWGVVAASCLMGRSAFAPAFHRFRAEGAWGISPHLIPHRSLHSLSGTVSQALKIRGPNFGAGGGPGGAVDGLLAASALLDGGRVPGVWLVLTRWHPEPTLDPQGQFLSPGCVCTGLALALTASAGGSARLCVRVVPAGDEAHAASRAEGGAARGLLSFESLVQVLAGPDAPPTAIVWRLPFGGRIELERKAAPNGAGPRGGGSAARANGAATNPVGAGAEIQA